MMGGAAGSVEFSTAAPAPAEIGAGAGKSWPELMARYGMKLAGERGVQLAEEGLVLEVKFLGCDKEDSPVLMLKPGRPGERGSEKDSRAAAAVILESEGEASVYFGRKRSLSEAAFLALLRQRPGAEVLAEYRAEPGQVFIALPGVPHALGRRVLAYYVVLRRKEEKGVFEGSEARALITPAVSSSRLFIRPLGAVRGGNAFAWLYAAHRFTTLRLELRAPWEDSFSASGPRPSFSVLTALRGRALLTSDFQTETLAPGTTIVISASCPRWRIHPGPEGAIILQTWLCEPAAEIEAPLRSLGMSQREIEGLFGFFGRS